MRKDAAIILHYLTQLSECKYKMWAAMTDS